MEEIKKYKCCMNMEFGGKPVNVYMLMDSEGDYVRYHDIKHLLDQPKCNCEDMINMVVSSSLDSRLRPRENWFCPAHGYKRR